MPLKNIVYVLKNEATPPAYYTGLTSNLAARIEAHNAGRVPHTAKGRPDIAPELTSVSIRVRPNRKGRAMTTPASATRSGQRTRSAG